MANIFRTITTKFYQNWPDFVDNVTKYLVCFGVLGFAVSIAVHLQHATLSFIRYCSDIIQVTWKTSQVLNYCIANLFRTIYTKCYLNRLGFVKDVLKTFGVFFFGSQCRWVSQLSCQSFKLLVLMSTELLCQELVEDVGIAAVSLQKTTHQWQHSCKRIGCDIIAIVCVGHCTKCLTT